MDTMATTYHTPVLLTESIDALNIKPNGIYVDVTFGGGGHSREILSRLCEDGKLYGFDQDADAEKNIPSNDDRFTFIRSNFRYLKQWLRYYEVESIDGLIADLGVSSHHLDDETRGFSFRYDTPIDMRMNNRAGLTAADIVNTYPEEQIADILYAYGELRSSRKLASAIVAARSTKSITKAHDLVSVLEPLLRKECVKKDLARVFQALRIEVNHEMDSLRDMLKGAIEYLNDGGRLSVITYHSLEDRIVKNVMKTGSATGHGEKDFFGRFTAPLKQVEKVITPKESEVELNPRSRSAKLRIAEKIVTG